MLRILVSSLLLFVVACGGGGSDSGGGGSACSAFRIVNGAECTSDALPVVLLLVNGSLSCTGTFITQEDILTAAHCVNGASSIEVLHDRGRQAAVGWIANPNYIRSGGNPAFDMGLVKVRGLASDVGLTPASFFTERASVVGDKVKVVGYGKDGSPSLPNGNPRAVELTIIDFFQGLFVTVFDENQSGTCQGDSGAAATINGRIAGTVQGGLESCGSGNPNFFADTQITGNVRFLESAIPGLQVAIQ